MDNVPILSVNINVLIDTMLKCDTNADIGTKCEHALLITTPSQKDESPKWCSIFWSALLVRQNKNKIARCELA